MAQSGDKVQRVALDAQADVISQIRLRQQTTAIAGGGHGRQQIMLLEAINLARDLSGIRNLSAGIVRPNQLAQRAGGEDVFISSQVEGSGTISPVTSKTE